MIREAITSSSPMSKAEHLPGCCHACCCCGCFTTKTPLISDWASLHSDEFAFKGCQVILHIPFQGSPSEVPLDVALPFKAQPGKLAVLVYGKHCVADVLKEACALTAPVSMEMFNST